MSEALRVTITGAGGRMGQALAYAAQGRSDLRIAAALDHAQAEEALVEGEAPVDVGDAKVHVVEMRATRAARSASTAVAVAVSASAIRPLTASWWVRAAAISRSSSANLFFCDRRCAAAVGASAAAR